VGLSRQARFVLVLQALVLGLRTLVEKRENFQQLRTRGEDLPADYSMLRRDKASSVPKIKRGRGIFGARRGRSGRV
jgi:hypothetical protein